MKRHIYVIEPLEYSVNGYTHAVKRITTVSEHPTYRSTTGSHYFRSEVAALQYIKQMAKEPNAWKVFTNRQTGKELFAYSIRGTFAGEEKATKELLSIIHGIELTDIDITIELREE